MKKSVFILAFAALMGTAATAQDTISADRPKDSYFYNNWFVGESLIGGPMMWTAGSFVENAYSFIAQDTLQIKGIAVSLSLEEGTGESYLDTTLDNVYRYVRLYVPDGDSLRMLAEQRIDLPDTLPTYCLALKKKDMSNPDSLLAPILVYECFFDQPIAVTDTFFLSFDYESFYNYYDTTINRWTQNQKYAVGINSYSDSPVSLTVPVTVALRRSPTSIRPGQNKWLFRNPSWSPGPIPFLYAIIEMDTTGGGTGDSTAVGGDTLTVLQSDMMARYVSVQPNPAVKEARVLSSFGLTRIEAYDDRGRLVLAREASGLEATLDVAAWPRGTYLLRIATPMGAVTKKLIVQ